MGAITVKRVSKNGIYFKNGWRPQINKEKKKGLKQLERDFKSKEKDFINWYTSKTDVYFANRNRLLTDEDFKIW